MQEPNTVDPVNQVGGAPPSPATDAASVPASPAVVDAEVPALGDNAAAEEAEVPPAEKQTAEAASAAAAEVAEADAPASEKPADEPTEEPTDEPVAEAVGEVDGPGGAQEEGLGEGTEPVATETPVGDTSEGVGEATAEGTGEAAAEGVGEASEPIPAETTETGIEDEAEDVAETPVGEAVTAEPSVAGNGAADDTAAAGTSEGTAEAIDTVDAETPADTRADAAEFVGDTQSPADLEGASGTAGEGAVAPVLDESVSDLVDAEATEEAPATEEEPAETAAGSEGPESVGSEVAVAVPAATVVQQPHGVWTDEQVEAFRTRLREVTATVVDKAAGAVIEAVNTVAAVIRSRTSSDRRGDDSSG